MQSNWSVSQKCLPESALKASLEHEYSTAHLIAKLAVYKIEPGVYEFNVSNGTHTLYEDAGLASIEAALMAAAEQDGPVCGFEVSYGSIVVGTYLCEELKTQAAQSAEHAVERQAVFTER